MSALVLALVVLLWVAAVLTLTLRSHVAALAALSVLSLGLALLFVWLRAPNITITKTTISAGLGGVMMALAMRRLGLARLGGDDDGA